LELTTDEGRRIALRVSFSLTQAGQAVTGSWNQIAVSGVGGTFTGTLQADTLAGTLTWDELSDDRSVLCRGSASPSGRVTATALSLNADALRWSNCTGDATQLTWSLSPAVVSSPR
jgi:hypothetical protein